MLNINQQFDYFSERILNINKITKRKEGKRKVYRRDNCARGEHFFILYFIIYY